MIWNCSRHKGFFTRQCDLLPPQSDGSPINDATSRDIINADEMTLIGKVLLTTKNMAARIPGPLMLSPNSGASMFHHRRKATIYQI
jgi:hypothetical protein